MKMKTLSLKQPFANLVASGQKTIETRRWKTNYRGDILICSSKTVLTPPVGFALCIVELYDIVPMKKGHEKDACTEVYDGAYAWMLQNLRLLKTIFPVKGQLGIFNLEVSEELLRF